jgi:sulfur transfer complex TusBCD TusB component (DsrH family)
VVLVHDAVMETQDAVVRYLGEAGVQGLSLDRVAASRRDAGRRQVGNRWPTIDYRQMVELMAEVDRVISW